MSGSPSSRTALRPLDRLHRCEAGATMVEAALVMIPLLLFVMLPPVMLHIWANEQYARTEAHRDAFDKTTMAVLLFPEVRYGPHGGGIESGELGALSRSDRKRIFPGFPPDLPTGSIDLPDGHDITVGPVVVDNWPEGLPNQYVEGWQEQVVKPRGGWFAGDIELYRYAAVIRSPWTWLGWPFIPTQDAVWEPARVRGWYEENTVDGSIGHNVKDNLKLLD